MVFLKMLALMSVLPLFLLHLFKIGGGVAGDGFEYGYGHYGLGGSDCFPGGGNSDNTGRGGGTIMKKTNGGGSTAASTAAAHEDAGSSSSISSGGSSSSGSGGVSGSGGGSSGGASDEAPSGFVSLGHEFRIPTKGFGGRLPELRCHRKLVVLNLSGTSVVGDIKILEALPKLQVGLVDWWQSPEAFVDWLVYNV